MIEKCEDDELELISGCINNIEKETLALEENFLFRRMMEIKGGGDPRIGIYRKYYSEVYSPIVLINQNNFPQQLYMYQPLDNSKKEDILNCLKNKKLYFRSVEENCNDFLEFSMLSIDYEKFQDDDKKWIKDSFVESKKNFRINCLSANNPEDNDKGSIHMWREYARDTGICIEIDFGNPNNQDLRKRLRQVKYLEKEIDISDLICRVVKLDIEKCRNNIIYDIFENNLYRKLKTRWEIEKEYRIISGKKRGFLDENSRVSYHPNKIFYRPNISNENKEKLEEIASALDIQLVKVIKINSPDSV